MWVNSLDAGLLPVLFDDLLDPAWRIRSELTTFEKELVFGVGLEVTRQDQSETGWKQNVAILRSFALIDENLAVAQIHVADLDVHKLAHPDRREEQQPEHDLVLNIAAVLNRTKESLQIRLAQ